MCVWAFCEQRLGFCANKPFRLHGFLREIVEAVVRIGKTTGTDSVAALTEVLTVRFNFFHSLLPLTPPSL